MSMKAGYYIALISLLVFGYSEVHAQQAGIAGRVLRNNQPLESATIMISENHIMVKSDAKGFFQIDHLQSGVYKLLITYTGFQVYDTTVQVGNQTLVLPDIQLVPDHQRLEQVIVTESYEDRRKRNSNFSVEVVSSDYIQRYQGGSLMKSLERLPGINNIGIGSGNSKPLIRGLGFNQVVVVENGVKHEGQQWGADHGLEIDQYSAHRVEIIKGAASFMYGSDAIAGAIDIQPSPAPEKNTWGGSVDLSGKTNNALAGTSLNLYGRTDKLFFDIRATGISYGDYKVPADTVYVYDYAVPMYHQQVRNTAGRDINFHLSTGWLGKNVKSIFYASRIYNKSGFFANAHGLEPRRVDHSLHDASSRDILLPRQNVTHYKLINKTSIQLQKHHIQTEIGVQRNFRQEWNHYTNHGYMPAIYPDTLMSPVTLERQYDKYVYSFNIRDQIRLNKHLLTIGGNAEYQQNTIDGWGFLIPAFNQFTGGVYAYDQYRLNDDVVLHGAIRMNYAKIEMKKYTDWFPSYTINGTDTTRQYLRRVNDINRDFTSLNWSVGVNYTKDQWLWKLNVGTSFRMPIAKELGVNGVNYHYFRYEKGDASLSPERSFQVDVEANYKDENWSLQLSPFFNYFPNYIFLNPTSSYDYFYGAGNQVFYYAQSRVMRYGAELQAKYRFSESWSSEILGEYIYNEQLSGNKKGYTLPFTPPASVLMNISFEPANGKRLKDNYFSLDYRITATQKNIVPPERITDGYQLFNFQAGTRWQLNKQDIHINLQVQNVFNTKYMNHTSFYRLINLPEPGRNIILSLKIPFQFSAGKE